MAKFYAIDCTVNIKVGCDDVQVILVDDDTDIQDIECTADELARDNADMYGCFDDCDDDEEQDIYSYSIKELTGWTEKRVIKEYGSYDDLRRERGDVP